MHMISSCLIKNISARHVLVVLLLFSFWRSRDRLTERHGEIFQPLVYSSNAQNDALEPKSGNRNSTQLSHLGDRDLSTTAITAVSLIETGTRVGY